MPAKTDKELIDALVELDDSDADVSPPDDGLIDTCVKKHARRDWRLSTKQREWAKNILERYESDDDDE